ncbi:UDP-2,4-diacetamido-2,4,6-trideoxy-beta-L-altropyranose hydrolase [Lentibacillus halophilus]|uniref:UDP-2,4-diacetamido-2,4, 6-trideoxy-beta-L-altropyranose hydrolase n=1 Tax=Lentibacillus halophilus TaxID=295065 RepID=A0ABP3IZV1_9BACI
MKVLIFTEGGSQTGLGHISRCSSLYDEIESRGIAVEMIINGNNKDLDMLQGKNYKIVNWLSKDFLKKYVNKDVYCIIDSYLADENIYQLISDRAKKCLYIDDNARINYPPGVIVNPSLSTDGLVYSDDRNNGFLLGHKYIILRRPFINQDRQKINKHVNTVLITMGGSGLNNLTLSVLNQISSRNPYLTFHVIVGKDSGSREKIINEIGTKIEMHQNITAYKMKKIMLDSDLAITAAGQTVYELLSTKTPFIPVKVAENQKNNIESLKRFNLVEAVLDYQDLITTEKLRDEFHKLNSFSLRCSLVQQYAGVVDGMGAKRIVDNLVGGKSYE